MTTGVFQIQAIPSKPIHIDAVRLELLNELRKQGRLMAKDLRATVATWTDPPKFSDPDISLAGGNATVVIEPTGSAAGVQHFEWVDKGTRDHWVPKSGSRRMAFRPGYRAKTKIRVIGSSSGGAFGGRIVRYGRWRVKGIKARSFRQTVQARRIGPYEAAMREAVARGAEKLY